MFSRTRSLFPSNHNDPNRLYQQPYSQAGGNAINFPRGSEINLREELDEFFFGYKSGIRHGYFCLIRHLRRTSTSEPIKCTCYDSLAREGDPSCSYCAGEGYLFDEAWAWTYSMFSGAQGGLANKTTWMPPGAVKVDYKVFFFRYDVPLLYGDKIIEVKLDSSGNTVLPVVRSVIYKPQTLDKHRADNSRIEFISAYCREDSALRLEDIDE